MRSLRELRWAYLPAGLRGFVSQVRRRVRASKSLDPVMEQVDQDAAERALMAAFRASLPPQPGLVAGSVGAADEQKLLRVAGLVDARFYQRQTERHIDDAVCDYLERGAAEGLDPNPWFDTSWYRWRFSVAAGVNPLVHYVRDGAARGHASAPGIDVDEVRRRLELSSGSNLVIALAWAARAGGAARYLELRSEQQRRRWRVEDLAWRELLARAEEPPGDFALYRIIGNDLPPRHERGQSLRNLAFILEHENEFPGVEKRYILNRLVDADIERSCSSLLDAHGASYLRLPFDTDEYRSACWRPQDFERPGVDYARWFQRLPPVTRAMMLDHLHHDKNLYVMNNNGARNVALREGRRRARWVLPFDGNCFFTDRAWDELRQVLEGRPVAPHVLVPMARLDENKDLLIPGFRPDAQDEPQIVFRADSSAGFDEDRRYGRRPKVSLFRELGVPGAWDSWRDEPWEQPKPSPGDEWGAYQIGGWVARLASGRPEQERDERERRIRRMEAIRSCLDRVDTAVLGQAKSGPLVVRNLALLREQRDSSLLDDLDLERLLRSVGARSRPGRDEQQNVVEPVDRLVILTVGGWLAGSDQHVSAAVEHARMLSASLPATWKRVAFPPEFDLFLDAFALLATLGFEPDPNGTLDVWLKVGIERSCHSRRARRVRRTASVAALEADLYLAASQRFVRDLDGLRASLRRLAVRRDDRLRRGPQLGVVAAIGPVECDLWARADGLANNTGLGPCVHGTAREAGLALVGSQRSEQGLPPLSWAGIDQSAVLAVEADADV